MFSKSDLNLHEEAIGKTAARAIEQVKLMNLPKQIHLQEEVTALGEKVDSAYKKNLAEFKEKYGEHLPILISIAIHEFWYSCWDAASYIHFCIENGLMNDNEYTRNLATALGYSKNEGMAFTLYDQLAKLTPEPLRFEFIKGTPFCKLINQKTSLDCMFLYWLQEAEREVKAGKIESAIDLVYEAFDAKSLVNGLHMFKEGEEVSEENAKSEFGRKGANALHQETYKLRDEVIQYYRKNISPKLSNDGAAELLRRQFPLALRTLSGYVSDEKKLRSASKA